MVKKSIVLLDLIGFNLAFLIAYYFRISSKIFEPTDVGIVTYTNLIIFADILLVSIFATNRLYRDRRYFTTDEFMAIFKSLFLVFLILTATTFLFKATIYSRMIISITIFLALILITLTRKLYHRLNKKLEYVLILTKNKLGERIERKIKENQALGYKFLCYINSLSEIRRFPQANIVFITQKTDEEKLTGYINQFTDIEFKIVPSLLNLITKQLSFDDFADIPLITVEKRSVKESYLKLKRIFDVFLASLAVIILTPLLIFIALSIKLTSKGPIIIKQQRLGRYERPFTFYKFRTMRINQEPKMENEVEYLYKVKNDPRVTGIGKVLRRICLDELPQLFNVIRGDMSLVGPRPHFREEMEDLRSWQKKRFEVSPGMTGLWQISGRHELSFDRTMILDLYYINRMSLLSDIKILIKTIPAIVFSKGRW